MATLASHRVLIDAAADTGFAPFGIPACASLSDGTFAVAVGYLTSSASKIRVYHLAADLTTLGMLDIDWGSAGFGFPYLAATEDRTAMMIAAPDIAGNPGLVYLLDLTGADPVVQSSQATAYPPRGGWNGWPAGVIYLREHAIVVVVTEKYVTTYRHGEFLSSLNIQSYWNEIVGVWPNPDDPSKFAVDFLGSWQDDYHLRTYEYTVASDGSITGTAMTLPTFSTWWVLGTSSPYDPDSVVVNSIDTAYQVTARDGTILFSTGLTDFVGATGVSSPHVLGMTDAKRILFAHGHYVLVSGETYDVTSRLIDVDYEAGTIQVSSPAHGATPVYDTYDLTIAGSTAISHRDGRVLVVGCYVDSGFTGQPDYFCLVAWAYDGGVEYPFRVKDGAGNWRKVGDGQSADGGRLGLHDGEAWCQEQDTAQGESVLYPLKLKVADDRWETVAMLTKGEPV